jgi:anti-sigma B factor antagonist
LREKNRKPGHLKQPFGRSSRELSGETESELRRSMLHEMTPDSRVVELGSEFLIATLHPGRPLKADTEAFNRSCVLPPVESAIIFLVNAISDIFCPWCYERSKHAVCGWPANCNGAAMELNISNRKSGEVEILTLSGRLTLGDGTSAFRESARKALDHGSDVLVDLSDVNYVDSAGLGELVSAYTSATNRGRKVKLLRPLSRVSTLLHVTKLYSTFETFEDEAEAIASFKSSAADTGR